MCKAADAMPTGLDRFAPVFAEILSIALVALGLIRCGRFDVRRLVDALTLLMLYRV